jgi:hypothetical protein
VAWRWLCEADAGLDRRELSRVGEAIFAYLDELAAACAQGYAEARVQAAGERQRRSRQLLGMIVSEPPPDAELVAGLGRAVGWVLPARVAVAALGEWRQQDALLLPPDVLADSTRPDPCLLVPDPDGPGRQAAIGHVLRSWPAAIGPSVPLARAAMSLRWARRALALAQAGVIAGPGPVRCDQHLSTLLILADEDLAGTLRSSRLASLARLRPGQRDRIADTLLAWLQSGGNAAEVAQRIHVHPADGQVPAAADPGAVRRPVARPRPAVRAAAGAAHPHADGRPGAEAGHLASFGLIRPRPLRSPPSIKRGSPALQGRKERVRRVGLTSAGVRSKIGLFFENYGWSSGK